MKFDVTSPCRVSSDSPKAVNAAAEYRAVGPGANCRAKHVVEVRSALRRGDRVATSDVGLVHELLVTTLDEGKAVPEEGFGLRRVAGRPVVAPYRCRRELAVVVVGEGAAAANRRRRQPDAWIVALPHHAIDA